MIPTTNFSCRAGCAGCCISISIGSALPQHPNGKPAGVRCLNLNSENLCQLWGSAEFPEVCRKYPADPTYCGDNRDVALYRLRELEILTTPD